MAFDDIKNFTISLLAKLPLKQMEQAWKIILNKCEEQGTEITALKDELQRAKDEINKLKGEKGQPKIPKNNGTADGSLAEDPKR